MTSKFLPKLLLVISILAFQGDLFSQTDQWTWVGGSNTYATLGVYGIQGQPSPTTMPGSRYSSIGWTDNQDRFWMFGGMGLDMNATANLNDLWRFDPLTGLWTWINGDKVGGAVAVYGTQGQGSANSNPGARFSSISWQDSSQGQFWLFGGYAGGGLLNDLWRFDPFSGAWTWVSGSTTQNTAGVYGTQGQASINNSPGARQDAISWTDKQGHFWMFGGQGYTSEGVGYLNDLWRYDLATGTWTWVKGSNTINAPGVYGTKGQASTNNSPGGRYKSTQWTDSQGRLWLFGGWGHSSAGEGFLNDLWYFDPGAGTWTWVSGSNTPSTEGVYGTKGQPSASNGPGSRGDASSWTDSYGRLWMFGGYCGNFCVGRLNDLWRFDPVTGIWTWMSGTSFGNIPAIYGTKGQASPNNSPGGMSESLSWTDGQGRLWMFGGVGSSSHYNTVWRFDPVAPGPINQPPVANAGADQSITLPTSNTSVAGSGTDPDGTISTYSWTKVSGPAGGTIATPTTALTNITGLVAGTYTYRLTVTDNGGASAFDDVQITVNRAPNVPPTADAGADQTIVLPTNSVALDGIGTDLEGPIWMFEWTKVSGPAGDNIESATSANTNITGLVAGTYIYRLTVTDNDSATAFDDIQITVNSAPGPGPNQAPTANAGADQTITLPTNSVTLNGNGTDPDGTISSYAWSRVGGPAAGTIATPSTASTSITGLIAGTYIYRLTITDNAGATATDDVQIIVNIAPAVCVATGTIFGEGYTNIPGSAVADLTNHPNYPLKYSVSGQLSSFEYQNIGENYGVRIRGYLCVPQTGAYTFFISGDEQADLLLSTNDNPANAQLITNITSPTNFQQWNKSASQQSQPVLLTAGVSYYIEAQHKEGVGSDHLSVGWKLPDGNFEGPIPGIRLSPFSGSGSPSFEEAMRLALNQPLLAVNLGANPSASFSINLQGIPGTDMRLVVTDVFGRIVESRSNLQPNTVVQLGQNWRPGIHMVQVQQGNNSRVIKLVRE